MVSMAISSSFRLSSLHSLSSMSSVVGCGSCLQNQGGLLKLQQVLVGPHPAPSQSGSMGSRCIVHDSIVRLKGFFHEVDYVLCDW